MNQPRFTNKRIIITGAGRGIGAAIARRFAAEGGEVMLLGRTREPLETVAASIHESGGRAWTFVADVSQVGEVETAVTTALSHWQQIDVLVNNAGVADEETPFLEMSEAQWDRVLDINLKGCFLMSQAVARAMVGAGDGVILHNASIAGLNTDGPYANYAASKAGLLALNRSMAVELARHHIRVNAVSPGYTYTEMTETAVTPTMLAHMQTEFGRVPLRRLVTADEVAATFAFLASADAAAITGANIIVDGGLTANWYILETLPK
jgi:NAD(P)-dependent dehydrogenase (short-subunit alcohol dehydrogenase family)